MQLTIVQPYIPAYRIAFFEGLVDSLAEKEIRCTIAAPYPRGELAKRGDAARPAWATEVRRREVEIAGRNIVLGGSHSSWRNSDAVILGNRGSSLDNYLALVERRTRGLKVGLWGHIKDYVTTGNIIDQRLERYQMRHADHIFAYVPSGSEYARSLGVDSDRVTTVMNTIDDGELSKALLGVTEMEKNRFKRDHGLHGRRIFAYVGGIDESKRIRFLVGVLSHLREMNSRSTIIMAGRGALEDLLVPFERSGHVVRIGYAGVDLKALVLSISEAIVMPGRVGLIAVDALVSGRAIITTDWAFHAPEIEYLREGESVFKVPNNVLDFAAKLDNFSGPVVQKPWVAPSMRNMIRNFANGVETMMLQPTSP